MDFTTMEPYYDEHEAEASALNMTKEWKDLKMDSNFAMLLCSLVFAIGWVVYITYYNSRVVGYIITKIINRLFIRDGYFKIGNNSRLDYEQCTLAYEFLILRLIHIKCVVWKNYVSRCYLHHARLLC